MRRLGILTGGGDCPGLNAVIRAVVKTANRLHGFECLGFEDAYEGMVEGRYRKLDFDGVSGILHLGGTILGTSNKCNPFQYRSSPGATPADVSEEVVGRCLGLGLEALVVIGGDGTLSIAHDLHRKGLPVVAIPKTIDNDLHGTDLTFGHDTAVAIATDAIDRLRTTAQAHHRAMIVELMGRNAGWLALRAALASGGDVVLIPELPFQFEMLVEEIRRRHEAKRRFSIVVVSEGARPEGGDVVVRQMVPDSPDPLRLGGIGEVVANALRARVQGVPTRVTVLGHVQRGGTPTAFDRVLATQFGVKAGHLVNEGRTGTMVAYRGGSIREVALEVAAQGQRLVPPGHPLVASARCLGMSFADGR
ncbi:MAG: 6-phosphofructokinase [Candidatus Krumholzibacteriia bacterium]